MLVLQWVQKCFFKYRGCYLKQGYQNVRSCKYFRKLRCIFIITGSKTRVIIIISHYNFPLASRYAIMSCFLLFSFISPLRRILISSTIHFVRTPSTETRLVKCSGVLSTLCSCIFVVFLSRSCFLCGAVIRGTFLRKRQMLGVCLGRRNFW